MAEWLNLNQAWAWIAFRDRALARTVRTAAERSAITSYFPDGAFRNWPDGAVEAKPDQQLQTALEQGALVAHRPSGTGRERVDPIFWMSNRPWRAPNGFLVEKQVIERLWPAEAPAQGAIHNKQGARELWLALSDEKSLSKNEAARRLQAAYETAITKPAPSHSTLERWITEWRRGEPPLNP